MYLDKHDIKQLKAILEEIGEFEEYLYLVYRRTEDGKLDVASGYDEIAEYKLDGRDDGEDKS